VPERGLGKKNSFSSLLDFSFSSYINEMHQLRHFKVVRKAGKEQRRELLSRPSRPDRLGVWRLITIAAVRN
jgi:hypothetical protein